MSIYKKAVPCIIAVLLYSLTMEAQNTEQENKNYLKESPAIPVGLDAYRMWHQWPVQRIGARAYMRSTYDRSGGNETADASRFLYMGEKEDHNYTLDIEG